jgi:predicted Zn-dependent protease
MSCKTSIDDAQQLSQTIESEYDIHTVNRTQELNQRYDKKQNSQFLYKYLIKNRWEHSVQSISQRVQLLQDSVRNSDSDIYSNSVEYPWQRSVAFNKVPYFIK